jgi:hypothetical protein
MLCFTLRCAAGSSSLPHNHSSLQAVDERGSDSGSSTETNQVFEAWVPVGYLRSGFRSITFEHSVQLKGSSLTLGSLLDVQSVSSPTKSRRGSVLPKAEQDSASSSRRSSWARTRDAGRDDSDKPRLQNASSPNGLPPVLHVHIATMQQSNDNFKLAGPFHRWAEQENSCLSVQRGDKGKRRRKSAYDDESGATADAPAATYLIALSQFAEVFNAYLGRFGLVKLEPNDRAGDVIAKTLKATESLDDANEYCLSTFADFSQLPNHVSVTARASAADHFVIHKLDASRVFDHGQTWLLKLVKPDSAVQGVELSGSKQDPDQSRISDGTASSSDTGASLTVPSSARSWTETQETEHRSRKSSEHRSRKHSASSDYMQLAPGATALAMPDVASFKQNGRRNLWTRLRQRLRRTRSNDAADLDVVYLTVLHDRLSVSVPCGAGVADELLLRDLQSWKIDPASSSIELQFGDVSVRFATTLDSATQLLSNTIAEQLLKCPPQVRPRRDLPDHISERDESQLGLDTSSGSIVESDLDPEGIAAARQIDTLLKELQLSDAHLHYDNCQLPTTATNYDNISPASNQLSLQEAPVDDAVMPTRRSESRHPRAASPRTFQPDPSFGTEWRELSCARLQDLCDMTLSKRKATATAADALAREQLRCMQAKLMVVEEAVKRIRHCRINVPDALQDLEVFLKQVLIEVK